MIRILYIRRSLFGKVPSIDHHSYGTLQNTKPITALQHANFFPIGRLAHKLLYKKKRLR